MVYNNPGARLHNRRTIMYMGAVWVIPPEWLFAAAFAVLAAVLGLISALRSRRLTEEERIRRLDEAMMKGTKDDPNEMSRFVP
jgi:uncharacterized membrane protein